MPSVAQGMNASGSIDRRRCIMEIGGQAVGLLAMEDHGSISYAGLAEAGSFDRRVCSRTRAAERAVRELCGVRRDKPKAGIAGK